jgi:hypothetical protein
MFEGSEEFPRDRVPKPGAVICAGSQNPSIVRTEHRIIDRILVVKGSDELAGGCIPESGGSIRARSQNPTAVPAEHRVVNPIRVD